MIVKIANFTLDHVFPGIYLKISPSILMIFSVFVRTVKDSQFVVACQQFRTRVCENLDIIIFSQTPVNTYQIFVKIIMKADY